MFRTFRRAAFAVLLLGCGGTQRGRTPDGWVDLEFTVTKKGTVENPRVLRSEPAGVFEESALRAILKWKYRPKVLDGKPVRKDGEKARLNFFLDK